MINTVQGSFQPEASPFRQRPWLWGFAGIGVDMSRDGKTVVIGTLPTKNVTTQSYTYVPS